LLIHQVTQVVRVDVAIINFVAGNELIDLDALTTSRDREAGQDAFAVIRDTIGKMNMVALGRVVLTRREHHKIPASARRSPLPPAPSTDHSQREATG